MRQVEGTSLLVTVAVGYAVEAKLEGGRDMGELC
jgi:hypothetical protein